MPDDEPIDVDYRPALLPPSVTVSRTRNSRRHTAARPGFLGGEAHPEYVVEIAYVCYTRSGRNVRQALRLMRQDWGALAPTVRDPDTGKLVAVPFPETLTHNTLYKWRRAYEWDSKLNAFVAEHIPAIRAEHIISAELGAGEGVRFLTEVVQGDHMDHDVDPRHVANRIRASELLIVAAGLGAHGTMNRIAPVIRKTIQDAIDISALNDQELARHRREALHAGRTDHEERKR